VDADILRVIIVKLQQREKPKSATLLIKVKAHRGCPLNEEADIRTEMGHMKQEQEKTWSTLTNRTIYQWSEVSKTKSGVNSTKQIAWTQAVRNRMRQKAGEIQAYRYWRSSTCLSYWGETYRSVSPSHPREVRDEGLSHQRVDFR